MICQSLFSRRKKEKNFNFLSAEFAYGVVNFKDPFYITLVLLGCIKQKHVFEQIQIPLHMHTFP